MNAVTFWSCRNPAGLNTFTMLDFIAGAIYTPPSPKGWRNPGKENLWEITRWWLAGVPEGFLADISRAVLEIVLKFQVKNLRGFRTKTLGNYGKVLKDLPEIQRIIRIVSERTWWDFFGTFERSLGIISLKKYKGICERIFGKFLK